MATTYVYSTTVREPVCFVVICVVLLLYPVLVADAFALLDCVHVETAPVARSVSVRPSEDVAILRSGRVPASTCGFVDRARPCGPWSGPSSLRFSASGVGPATAPLQSPSSAASQQVATGPTGGSLSVSFCCRN